MPSAALALLLASLTLATPAHAETPTEVRGWAYANYTLVTKAGWGFSFMPGLRYEMSDSEADAAGVAMHELFTGPFWTHKWGKLKLTLPLWYYYMGFPVGEDTFLSYNVELIPILRYQLSDTLAVQSRTIFHNKVYADNPVFTGTDDPWGYSLLLREMLTVELAPEALKGWSLLASEEVFAGVIEDAETRDIVKGEPFFAKRGFSMNRVYAGVKKGWKLGGGPSAFVVTPQYVLETHHDPEDGAALTKIRHYAFLTMQLVHVVPWS